MSLTVGPRRRQEAKAIGDTDLERLIRDRQAALVAAIGDEVLRARQDAGLSARALGRATGVDPSRLRRIERGRRDASLDSMVAIATALGREVSLRRSANPRARPGADDRGPAEALFEQYTPAEIGALKGSSAVRKDFIAAAGILASYNEGRTGPGQCDEDRLSSTAP